MQWRIEKVKYVAVLFSLLISYTAFSQQEEKCGTMYADSVMRGKIPNAPTLMDFEIWLQQKMDEQVTSEWLMRPPVYTIPVIVHVIHNGDALGTNENISQAQVMSQLNVLNEDFRRTNADAVNTPAAFLPVAADVEIEFCPALVDPNGNLLAEPGINRVNLGVATWTNTSTIDANLKPATIWDPNRYFNIWVVNMGTSGLLGYAQFPQGSGLAGMPTGAQNANTDGIVVRHTGFGRVGNVQTPFHLGRTATHEVGHWLGLRHIWGDGGCTADDYCADTPQSDASNNGCSPNHVSCNTVDMVQNYMDYSNDACMNIFTLCQKTRMRTVMLNSPRRLQLLNSTVCQVFPSHQVSGFVRDAQTLQGVPFAKVRFKNNFNNYETTADANGNFILADVFEGDYTVWGGQWSWVTTELTNVTVAAGMSPVVISVEKGYYDDFVLDFEWMVSGNAQAGMWERGVPIGTTFNGQPSNPGADVPNDFGEECYVTGNGGGAVGFDDVDNGNTILTSPVFNLTTYNEPYVNFYRWFFNAGGTGIPDDNLEIRLTNGITTAVLELIDVNTTPATNQWRFRNFRIRDYITPTANMRLILETADDLTGVGHLVEAAFDFFRVVDSLPKPFAAFTQDVTEGCPGLAVNFTDVSIGNPDFWNWSFPGGNPANSTLQNPTVTYNLPGVYTVTLTSGNAFGADTLVQTALITVQDYLPDFTANVMEGCPGLTINFSGESNCQPLAWAWSFPGGNPAVSNLQNPAVEYAAPGLYDVTLTITGSNGNHVVAKNGFINISNGLPVTVFYEDFESNSFATNGWTIQNPDNGITWNLFNVGGTLDGTRAAGINLFNYPATGQRDGLIARSLDLTTTGSTSLTFYHAHRRSSTAIRDSLLIYVSTDGGVTYPDKVFARAEDGTGSFATNTTTAVNFVPASTVDWCYGGTLGASCFTVNLSAYDGYPDVRLKFESFNSQGNNLYLDNISVSGECINPFLPPLATFNSSQSFGCVPHMVSFSDNSTENPHQWEWQFPGGTPAFSAQQNPVVMYETPGVYDVTLKVFNAFGADSATYTGYVEVFESPGVDITGSDVTCFGGNDGNVIAVPFAGRAPYDFEWSGGELTASLNGLSSGIYYLTVVDDNGCAVSDSVIIAQPTPLISVPVALPEICGNANGRASSITFGGIPPYNYQWNNGVNDSLNQGLTAGVYTVTISDANNCSVSDSISVVEFVDTLLLVTLKKEVTCAGGNDGETAVMITGGTLPYSFNWSNGSDAEELNTLVAGNYLLTVTDVNGCSITESIEILDGYLFNIAGIVSNTDCGTNSGSIEVMVTGGQFPFSYQWNDGSSDSTLSALFEGQYALTVTDSAGCQALSIFTVNASGGPEIELAVTAVSCAGGTDGIVTVNLLSGNPDFSYSWSTGDTTASILTGAGSYSVTVNDENNCTAQSTAMVSEPAPIVLNLFTEDIICNGKVSEAWATVSGGTGSFHYLWNNQIQNDTAFVGEGWNVFQATDSAGCVAVDSILVEALPEPVISMTSTPDSAGAGNGTATAEVLSGEAPFTFQWSDLAGQQQAEATGLSAGAYSVTITDGNGCSVVKTITVGLIASLEVIGNFAPSVYPNPNDGIFLLDAGGKNLEKFVVHLYNSIGMEVMQFEISTPSNSISVDLTSFGKGVYLLRLSNADYLFTRKIIYAY